MAYVPPLILKTNAAAPATFIKDIGIQIPGSGGQDTLNTNALVQKAQNSEDLRTLVLDDAYGPGSSTIIVNDGNTDIPQVYVDTFLDNIGSSGIAGTLDNLTATTDPTDGDDMSQGFATGSVWINTVSRKIFRCTDPTPASAVWLLESVPVELRGLAETNTGTFFLADRYIYSESANPGASTIQYTKVYLTAGLEIDRMAIFVNSGGGAGTNTRLGLYDQVDPTNPAGLPNARVAQTNVEATAGNDGSFKHLNLKDAPTGGIGTNNVIYAVPATGFYWVAFVTSSTSVTFAASVPYRANYIQEVRREGTTTEVLPVTAGTLTNPVAPLFYAAAVEQ